MTESNPESILFVLAVIAVLAAIVIQTVQGHLRWLWLNRHRLPRVIWRIGMFVALTWVITAGMMIVRSLLLRLPDLAGESGGLGGAPMLPQLVNYLFLTLSMFACGVIAVRFLDRRAIGSLGLGFHSRWFRQLCTGLLLGAVFVSAIVAVQAAFGSLSLERSGIGAGILARQFLLHLMLFTGVAFFEELVFRGYLLQVLAEGLGDFIDFLRQAGTLPSCSQETAWKIGKVLAAVLLSAPFGFAHYNNTGGTFIGAVSTGVAGLVLALAYFRTMSLWVPVGMHITWNFVMGWVFAVPVSGETISMTPFTATVSGPDWLSGGTFGPEGSVLAFIAMVCMIVFLARSRSMDATPEAFVWYPPPAARRVGGP